MQCPKCQFENPEGAKFCVECGNKIDIICPKCSSVNSPDFKFCSECGQKLSIPSEAKPTDFSLDEKLTKIQKYLPKGLTEKILSKGEPGFQSGRVGRKGTTYVTEDIFKLSKGFFRFKSLGVKDIKGKEKPIRVYRVIAPSTRRTRFDVSAERGLTAFVGREHELELMLDGFERTKSNRGQAFSITGEAGVGKSRLLFELRKAVANEGVTFLEGKCLSFSRGVAYHPVIDILKSTFDISSPLIASRRLQSKD